MSKKALGSSNVRLPNEKKLSSLAVLFFISLILSLQLSAKEWKEGKKAAGHCFLTWVTNPDTPQVP